MTNKENNVRLPLDMHNPGTLAKLSGVTRARIVHFQKKMETDDNYHAGLTLTSARKITQFLTVCPCCDGPLPWSGRGTTHHRKQIKLLAEEITKRDNEINNLKAALKTISKLCKETNSPNK